MKLNRLSLVQFKNIDSNLFEFKNKITCFVGSNGIGKTNILDAIYYLSTGKSYFSTTAQNNILHNTDFFVIEGNFTLNQREENIVCSIKKGQKKVLKRNSKIYERYSDHIGLFPVVIISPTDIDLINEGSETRRKFMNYVISQRNALLKYFAKSRTFDSINLQIYNDQLSKYGNDIYKSRVDFTQKFIPIIKEYYKTISGSKEDIRLEYISQIHNNNYEEIFDKSLQKDLAIQYTSVGIHRDNLSFEIDGFPIKKYGSQGQQKSFLMALKLAQCKFLKDKTNTSPILLLDDIFDKLDEDRIEKIINLINSDEFGQLFITDTHSVRTEEIVKKANNQYSIFKL